MMARQISLTDDSLAEIRKMLVYLGRDSCPHPQAALLHLLDAPRAPPPTSSAVSRSVSPSSPVQMTPAQLPTIAQPMDPYVRYRTSSSMIARKRPQFTAYLAKSTTHRQDEDNAAKWKALADDLHANSPFEARNALLSHFKPGWSVVPAAADDDALRKVSKQPIGKVRALPSDTMLAELCRSTMHGRACVARATSYTTDRVAAY